jgi:TetR/AcrR family transcriptional repressor of nem operon
MNARSENSELPETKRHLVDAGVALMRQQGYTATTVEDICAAAGVTKGAFFHYFKSKEDIARAALQRFGLGQDLHDAPFRKLADPMDRVHGRLEFIMESVRGESKGCLIGMIAQEMGLTSPEFRELCQGLFLHLANDFAADLAAAKAACAPGADFEPEKVAWLFVAIFQGSSLLAKVSGSNALLLNNIAQFQCYVKFLFPQPQLTTTTSEMAQPAEALDLAFD